MAEVDSVHSFLRHFSGRLPVHELEMLLESACSRHHPAEPRLTRTELYLESQRTSGPLARDWIRVAQAWAEQRLQKGTPIQHLTREAPFFGRYFESGPEALIPRPETEVLVSAVLEALAGMGSSTLVGAELGTGTGIISLTLIEELRARGIRLSMVASELTAEARSLALSNARRLGVDPSQFKVVMPEGHGSIAEPFLGQQPGGCDFWISNPPYLVPGDAGETEPEVAAFEPAEALFAPAGDPLYFYRRMAQGARLLVKPMGWIWVEIPHERADALKAVFDEPGLGFQKVKLIHDLTGRPRVLAAQWMGNKS